MAKLFLDLICSFAGSVYLTPVFFLIALLIKIDSAGPVLYRGIRTGRNGKPFKIFKFRTMIENAESLGGPSTGKDDPRITRVGKFLRKFKLDELPQLINVLKGEMSLVGPRPEVPAYTALYTTEEKLILSVRPGITDYSSLEFMSLSEVLGKEDADRVYEEQVLHIKNNLRVQYVKNHTFLGDLKIIIQTLYRLVRGKDGIR